MIKGSDSFTYLKIIRMVYRYDRKIQVFWYSVTSIIRLGSYLKGLIKGVW